MKSIWQLAAALESSVPVIKKIKIIKIAFFLPTSKRGNAIANKLTLK
jgi:hypothetical protein